ncbi:putative phosphoesterase [Methanocella paludicola SANAE]|uniref:Phosphoesterase n=1 Tax=Methanocella paludicola (strain DSM 17711 / JCM 13418 / NBRC 101707 / SANAE) TaxID=304371 RepID=D1YZS8_METPS|nr:YfcE family phosphodiesterase [Methanocella paludicola]BAI61950.1 putative phosphoesterase [Methanocella paludicola SANAE]
MTQVLFISDIHGNFEALKAVNDEVPYDIVFCLGDIVDYGPEPAECIDWLRKNNVATIRGNHDNAVAYRVDCGCGYVYKHLSEATREYTWASIDDNDISFLKGLPLLLEKEVDGVKLVLAHGSPGSFFDYMYPDTPAERLAELTGAISCDYLAVGHTHKPMIVSLPDKTILNPGSVGQPRDGDSRASCLSLDTATGDARIIRVQYDIDSVCDKIRKVMPHASELERILRRGY